MLDALRTKKWKTRLMWATLILIVPGFVAVTGSMGGDEVNNILRVLGFKVGEPDYAVKVDNIEIPAQEYMKARKNVIDRYSRNYKTQDINLIERAMDIDKITMDELIQEILLNREAKKRGLFVSDQEVANEIMSTPLFQDETRKTFSQAMYKRFLTYVGMNEAEYESEVKKQLLVSKLIGIVQDNLMIPITEVRAEFNRQYERVMVDYFKVDPEKMLGDMKVTDEELKQYYEAHSDQYMTKEEMVINYVEFPIENYKSKVTVSEQAIAEYVEANENKFKVPLQMELQHFILADFDFRAQAEASVTDDKLKKYYNEHNEEFVTSEQVRIDYVYFDRKAMRDSFKVSEKEKQDFYQSNLPRYTTNGKEKPFAEVAAGIETTLKNNKAEEEIRKTGQKVIDAVKGGKSLQDAAKEFKLEFHTSDLFRKDDVIDKKLTRQPLLESQLFAPNAVNKAGDIKGPTNIIDAAIVYQIKEVNPPIIPKYDDKLRSKVTSKWLDAEQKWLKGNLSNTLLKGLEEGELTMESALAKANKELKKDKKMATTGLFRIDAQTIDTMFLTPESMPVGFMSEVSAIALNFHGSVESKSGTHIYKVIKKIDEHIPELAGLKAEAESSIKQDKAEKLAADDAQKFRDKVDEKKDFDLAVKELELTVKSTGSFDRTLAPPLIGYSDAVASWVLGDLKVGDVSDVLAGEDVSLQNIKKVRAYYVLKYQEKIEPKKKPFEDPMVVRAVTNGVKAEKATKQAETVSKLIQADLDNGVNFEKIAQSSKLAITTTESFSIGYAIKDIGTNTDFAYAAFDLKKVGDVSDVVAVSTSGDNPKFLGYYVLRLKERLTPDEQAFGNKKEEILTSLRNRYGRNLETEWINQLTAEAEEAGLIHKNEFLLERAEERRKSMIGG